MYKLLYKSSVIYFEIRDFGIKVKTDELKHDVQADLVHANYWVKDTWGTNTKHVPFEG
jgi:hypothetical protein